MCEWMTEKLGRDATLRIGGRIAKTEFEIFAQFIGTVTLVKDKLSLREIMFKILLKGIDSNIRLSCTLYYTDAKVLGRDTTLQFTGKCPRFLYVIMETTKVFHSTGKSLY